MLSNEPAVKKHIENTESAISAPAGSIPDQKNISNQSVTMSASAADTPVMSNAIAPETLGQNTPSADPADRIDIINYMTPTFSALLEKMNASTEFSSDDPFEQYVYHVLGHTQDSNLMQPFEQNFNDIINAPSAWPEFWINTVSRPVFPWLTVGTTNDVGDIQTPGASAAIEIPNDFQLQPQPQYTLLDYLDNVQWGTRPPGVTPLNNGSSGSAGSGGSGAGSGAGGSGGGGNGGNGGGNGGGGNPTALPDAVILGNDGHTLSVLYDFNVGAGAFTTIASPLTTSQNSGQEVRFFDFNGDGKQDIFVLNASGSSDIFINNGSGGFNSTPDSTGTVSLSTMVGSRFAVGNIITGHVSGSGHAYDDVAVVNHNIGNPALDSVAFWFNDGAGDFTNGVLSTITPGFEIGDIGLADFNGDGNLDLFILSKDASTNFSQIWIGDGAGTFSYTPLTGEITTIGIQGTHLRLADMNTDGPVDLVIQNASNELKIWTNDGRDGSPGNPFAFSLNTNYSKDISTYNNFVISNLNPNIDNQLDIMILGSSTSIASVLDASLSENQLLSSLDATILGIDTDWINLA